MSDSTTAVSPEENNRRLAELEQRIALYTFVDRGTALREIAEHKLYKPAFPTFEAYCLTRWQLKRAHAYRLIDAAAVAKEVSPNGDIRKEAHARALLSFPEQQRAEALKKAIESAKDAGRPLQAEDIYSQLEETAPKIHKQRKHSESAPTLVELCVLWKKSSPAVRAEFLQWTTTPEAKCGTEQEGSAGKSEDSQAPEAPKKEADGSGSAHTTAIPESQDSDEEDYEYKCDNCDESFADDSEGVIIYECNSCDVRFTPDESPTGDHRCPECNKYAAKVSDCACPECKEGDLVRIGGDEV